MMTNGNVNNLHELYRRGCEAMAGTESAEFEAFQLIRAVLPLRDRGELALRGSEPVSAAQTAMYDALLARRRSGEPLQYILGEWEFFGLPFYIGEGVLIPRPETELLAQTVIDAARALPSPALLELCAGSGCISVAAAKNLPEADITAVELSDAAFGYLQRNIARSGCGNLKAVHGDALALPPAVTAKKYEVIYANPPYIPSAEIDALQPEVQREPRMALDGGNDGLDFYRTLPAICTRLLVSGGLLALEVGDNQGDIVSALLASAGYARIEKKNDLENRGRVITGRFYE